MYNRVIRNPFLYTRRLVMDNNHIEQMKQGFETACINLEASSNLAYKPQFVSNNYKEGRKVIDHRE